jgi:hypothetical protein
LLRAAIASAAKRLRSSRLLGILPLTIAEIPPERRATLK